MKPGPVRRSACGWAPQIDVAIMIPNKTPLGSFILAMRDGGDDRFPENAKGAAA
jgi:hypothetical protein